jgi:hypothetical protein
MANIRKETWRHDWRPQRIPQLASSFADEDDKQRMKLLCWNCRQPWDEKNMGPPPVDGCVSGVKVRLQGEARQRDYFPQEEARRQAALRAERQREAEAEQKLQEYLHEYARRHG